MSIHFLRTLLLNLLAVGALVGLSPLARAEPADEAAIRQVILSTWDRPDAPVEVGPIVVLAGRAVAGWTQGQHGGRALMALDGQGRWSVSACGGDGLKDAKTLEMTGLSSADAKRLSQSLAQAESTLPASRRVLFSTFNGMVNMKGAPGAAMPHAPGASAASHH